MPTPTMDMKSDLEKRVDALERKIGNVKTTYAREVCDLGVAWTKLAGRCVWFAGLWKRQAKIEWSLNTVARALDVSSATIREEMSQIAAAVPQGAGRWQRDRLIIHYPRFAEAGETPVKQVDVRKVFERWREQLHPKAVLDAKRKRCIEERLADGISVETILLAIRGIASSPTHVEKGWTDLTLICRDAEHVDKYARWATHGVPDVIKPENGTSMLGRIGGRE